MPSAKTDCPACGLAGSLIFYEGTENGAPYGAGYWPMQVSDADQQCECELTEEQWEAAADKAWAAVQAEYDADAEAQAQEFLELPIDTD